MSDGWIKSEHVRHGADGSNHSNIARLPEQWLEDEGYGDEGLEMSVRHLSLIITT